MEDRLKRLVPWLGIAVVAVFVLVLVIGGDKPVAGASGSKVISWYGSNRSGALASAYLVAPLVLLAIVFYGHLRDRIAEDSRGLAATAFGGALLFGASGAIDAGIQLALAYRPDALAPSAAHALNLVGLYGASIAESAGVSILLFAAGLAIVRGRQFPAWTGWLGLVLGVASLSPVNGLEGLLAVSWTLIISVVMMRQAPARAVTGRAAATAVGQPAR